MKKIRTKIFTVIFLCCMIVSVLIGTISSFKSSSIVKKNAEKNLNLVAESKANELNSAILQTESSVNGLATTALSMLDNTDALFNDPSYLESYQNNLEPIAEKFAKNTNGAMSVYIRFDPKRTPSTSGVFESDTKGNGDIEKLTPTDFSKYDENDTEHVGWYYTPIKAGKAVWLSPYKNANINVYMISYVVPIFKNGQTIGIVGMDINFKKIQDIVNGVKLYNTGNAFLLDKDNNFLIHPKFTTKDNLAKVQNGAFKAFSNKIANSKNSTEPFQYDYNNKQKESCFYKLSNGWVVCVTAPVNEIYAESNGLIEVIVVLIVLGVVISAVAAFVLGGKMSGHINSVTQLLNKTSELDLKDDSKYTYLCNYKDEIGQMARALFIMRKNLAEIVGGIYSSSENVSHVSEELYTVIQEVTDSMKAVTTAVNDISKGTVELAQETQGGAEKLDKLSQEIKNADDSSEEMKQLIETAEDANKHGNESIDKLQKSVTGNIEVTKGVRNKIFELDEKSKTISKITETIKGITSQINLLSLNASIESARAGEAGKGFAVVANEIKSLANATEKSTKEIENIINDLKVIIASGKDEMIKAVNVLNESDKISNETKNTFSSIENAVEDVVNHINNLIGSINNINTNKNIVINSIEGISAISEESASTTEEISASIDEQFEKFKKISESAQSVKNVTVELKQLVNRFKI